MEKYNNFKNILSKLVIATQYQIRFFQVKVLQFEIM